MYGPVYFYEGRTVRGVGWMSWGLLLQLVVLLAGAIATVLIFLFLGSIVYANPDFLTMFVTLGVVVCGLLVVEIAMVIIYLVGFHGMYSGRHEYGLAQDRMMDRALLFVILAIVFAATQVASPFTLIWGSPFGSPTVSTSVYAVLVLAIQPFSALFAGLALLSAVTVFADGSQRTRLVIGTILGAVGAAAGTAIYLASAFLGTASSSPFEATLAAAIAGQGTSAISLLVFFLVYREIRQKLEAGIVAPAVPRAPPIWPYYYYPPYAYPAPAPAAPPSPPSPPPSSPPNPP